MRNRHRYAKNIKIGEQKYLSQLKIGQRARVIELQHENRIIRRRLFDLGITSGVEVEIKKMSPLGDPIDIALRGYELCLRKSDLEHILIEVISWGLHL